MKEKKGMSVRYSASGDWAPSRKIKTVILYIMFIVFILGMILIQVRKG